MGTGMVVTGLASMIIGEVLTGAMRNPSIRRGVIASLLGGEKRRTMSPPQLLGRFKSAASKNLDNDRMPPAKKIRKGSSK